MRKLIRPATHDDIPALLVLAERFNSETTYGMELDEAGATQYLQTALADPDVVFFVSDDVSACIQVTVIKDWFSKPTAYVDYMFVAPEKRGIGLSHVLVQAVINYAKLRECSHVFSGTHASISARVSQMFINLFQKSGFTACGQNLTKALL